jgi:hypothetical protein
MGVIAILIGLLVPALNLVRDFAEEVEQKAQFHTLEVAIEMFSTAYGSYPPSKDNAEIPVHLRDATPYGGAQKLSEALVGWDLIGFHPKSDFRSDGTFSHINGADTLIHDAPAYHMEPPDYLGDGNPAFAETAAENIKARTPFMELENANAYKMEDVYGAANIGSFNADSFVICDEYAKKRSTGKKTGMPILYWRANTNITIQDSTADPDIDGSAINDDIYNMADNYAMLQLITAEQDPSTPRMDTDLEFDQFINNDDVPTTINRPYRAQSYILVSAGKDGYYGTADDVTNFDKKE